MTVTTNNQITAISPDDLFDSEVLAITEDLSETSNHVDGTFEKYLSHRTKSEDKVITLKLNACLKYFTHAIIIFLLFLVLISVLTTTLLFVASLVLYFKVDFGNFSIEQRCVLLKRNCDVNQVCTAQLKYMERNLTSEDSYPLSCSVWLGVQEGNGSMSCFFNKDLSRVTLYTVVGFDDFSFLIASSVLMASNIPCFCFGFFLLSKLIQFYIKANG